MTAGMQHFLTHHTTNNQLTLPNITITNQYCFFVAGIIGELLTDIFSYLIPEFIKSEIMINQSLHFGLFLQKVNMLKDKANDELAGRCYMSSRSELRASLLAHAQESIQYIVAIPIIAGRNYRLFCAWSLFIGLASLKWIDKAWETQKFYKISQDETRHIIHQLTQLIDDNHALLLLFKQYMPESGHIQVREKYSTTHLTLPQWFSDIYNNDAQTKVNHYSLGTVSYKDV
jgi:hypothetical protein